ncbi:hypothetical protein DPMN_156289 [Dreissena polymorpha]|uniref:Uncharacterized protein n=1 Tax=Dreissena polymorpha TaxID=45954 RepID=A0A9D4J7F4_DREPO|nr:hypothetical protein DPMN_156289 [Dreissena polymorpha]
MGGIKSDIQEITNSLYERVGAFGMEVSKGRSKIMVNITNTIFKVITINGEKLEKERPVQG